ncbi:MAG: D-TA family PLP-dependent enzyme [Verrucomicrobiota bacterium]
MDLPTGIEEIPSPGLLFDCDRIDQNLQFLLDQVNGEASLLRPHLKTHKCGEILRRQKEMGIDSVKCATLSEANLAAEVGVRDILIAYPIVGPNRATLEALMDRWPASQFSALVDSEESLHWLEKVSSSSGQLPVFLDLDIGMHRTGIARENGALALARSIVDSPALTFGGLHAYDGHIHASCLTDRRSEFELAIAQLDTFVSELEKEQIHVDRIVSGGSPTFAFHAERALSSEIPWECSPGTPLLWDAGYGDLYPEMPFEAAAFLLTRVISHPGEKLFCLDLGHKAVSAENPLSERVHFPALNEVEFVSQSEEHLVVRTSTKLEIGEPLLAIPHHVCPSVALHDWASLIRGGKMNGETWEITARSRQMESPPKNLSGRENGA